MKRPVCEGDIYRSLTGAHRLYVEFVFEQKLPLNFGFRTKAVCSVQYDDEMKPPRRLHVKVESLQNRKLYALASGQNQ